MRNVNDCAYISWQSSKEPQTPKRPRLTLLLPTPTMKHEGGGAGAGMVVCRELGARGGGGGGG